MIVSLLSAWAALLLMSGLQNDAQPSQELPRFRVEAFSTTLEVRVVDEKGRFVHGLTTHDIQVRTDGGRRPIRVVEERGGVRLNLAVLVDIGSEMQLDELKAAREAIFELIHLLEPEDRISLFAYDRHVRLLAGPTTDRHELVEALWNLSIGGRSSWWKRLGRLFSSSALTGFAVDEALLRLEEESDGVPVILVFSSAFGNIGRATEEHVARYRARIFGVGWGNPTGNIFNLGADRRTIQRLVGTSAGVMYSGSEIAERVTYLAEALKSYYLVVYVPESEEAPKEIHVEYPSCRKCWISFRPTWGPEQGRESVE
ncbi:MAG TPA: hypothetical protein P5568_08345 [Acidobacteriota bacterium]|nr:hypothetical protein [Acidobacteriota bacterium]HRV08464.1 hypothetical protein [Acidobacteriota bacterium]